jgi:tRNA (guanine37-N1)-methyltransferase
MPRLCRQSLRPVGKESGETAHIERFNNTLRQRLGRLVRKSLSCSRLETLVVACLRLLLHCYVLLCGRYEGVDERVAEALATDEVSIGDYVLSGGEPAAMVLIDAVVRLLPGALGSETSALFESFSEGLLDHPQYTRPPEFRGMKVPEVLLSGNHAEIERWRKEAAIAKTRRKRPDLLKE